MLVGCPSPCGHGVGCAARYVVLSLGVGGAVAVHTINATLTSLPKQVQLPLLCSDMVALSLCMSDG